MAAAKKPAAHTNADPTIPTKEVAKSYIRLLDPPRVISTAHDAGLRALGLLDFVRLDLSSSGPPRPDLIDELIANYSYGSDRSFVRGQEIKVSWAAFYEALSLPEKPTYCVPAGVDPAAVTSAAKQFIKVFFQRRLDQADAELRDVKNGRAHCVSWKWLILIPVRKELEQPFNPGKRTMICYYGAYIQRLIWLQRPELFQLPPEPDVPMIQRRRPQEEQGSNPSAVCENQKPSSESGTQRPTLPHVPPDAPVNKNQKRCLESNIQGAGPMSEQIDMASKKIDSASEKFDAASEKFDAATKMIAAASKIIEDASGGGRNFFEVGRNVKQMCACGLFSEQMAGPD